MKFDSPGKKQEKAMQGQMIALFTRDERLKYLFSLYLKDGVTLDGQKG